MTIFGQKVKGLADTGASVSIISSKRIIERLGLKIQPCDLQILTADRTPYTCLGYVNIPFEFQNKTKIIPTLVVPEIAKDLIFGMDFLRAFDFQLIANSSQIDRNEDTPLPYENEGDMICSDEYFGEQEQICFHVVPTTDPNITRNQIDEDESLEMPTIEIPAVS